MKKLLLLALSVTAAASLTACGGNAEIDELMEAINPTEEGVVANYQASISYGTLRHFNVNGNTYNYCGYGDTMYDADSTANDFYEFVTNDDNEVTSVNRWTSPTDTTADSLTLENSTSSSYEYVGYLYQGPFAYLEDTLKLEDSITSKDFEFDKDSETYYFVNPTADKLVQDATTVSNSNMTIKLTYNEDGDLVKAEIEVGSMDFVYNFKEVTFTMPGATTETPEAGTETE